MNYDKMTPQQAIELLCRMIEIPSQSGKEQEVADLLSEYVRALGFEPKRSGNNLWIVSPDYSDEKPTILFDAHIDTVRPSASWTYDPYKPTIVDGKLYGLGSNDTGGSVVSMLAAFVALTSKPQPFNLIWLASAEEENTGPGGIQSVVDKVGKVDLAIVGEPTGMNPAIAEKGLFVIDCIAHGKAGHAARGEGINAIYEAMADLEWFRTYRFERVSPLLGEVKMTVTGINAGTLHNVVPAECRMMVDVRVNELYDNEEIYEEICRNVKSEVVPRSFRLNSSSISPEHPIVVRAEELGGKAFASPTTSNQAVIPWLSVKMGPGDSSRSHTADEYIYLSEIEHAVEFYIALLDGFKL